MPLSAQNLRVDRYRPLDFLRAAHRAWTLANTVYGRGGIAQHLKQHCRWAVIAATRPSEALDWFSCLDAAEMRPFVQRIPYLTFKPLRIYLSTRWDFARRKKVILDTFRFIRNYRGALLDASLQSEGFVLARLDLEGHDPVSIVLRYDNGFRKEGDLMASLRCDSMQGPIYTMAFSLEQLAGGDWVLYIGSIQGYYRRTKDEIKAIAKAFHGLRPKALMVFIAQEMADAMGLTHLYGVSNGIQPHLRKHLIHLRRVHDLNFDYDSLWGEMGGARGPDGWFELPTKSPRRTENEMRPNKRTMYFRRYKTMDLISRQIQESLPAAGAP